MESNGRPFSALDLVGNLLTEREQASVSLNAWTKAPRWKPYAPADAPAKRCEQPSDGFLDLLDRTLESGMPEVVSSGHGELVVAFPLDVEDTVPAVVVAELAADSKEAASLIARLLQTRVATKLREQHSRCLSERYLAQIRRDQEELSFLHALLEGSQIWDLTRPLAEAARPILPQLRGAIGADSVAMLLDAGGPGCETTSVPGSDDSVLIVGRDVLHRQTYREIASNLQESADRGLAVANGVPVIDAGKTRSINLLAAPLMRGRTRFGWLLAVRDRTGPRDDRSGTPLARHEHACREFCPNESGLLKATALLLAAQGCSRKLIAEYSDSARRAQDGSRAKSDFLANMSHEIRTPMTAILGFIDVLYREGDLSKAPPERIDAIMTISRNANSLLQIIDDILDLSKIETGKLVVEETDVSPRDIVLQVVDLMQMRAVEKGVNLDLEEVGPLPETITSDPARIRQILVNLVGNAIKFTEQGCVRLLVEQMDGDYSPQLEFRVADTGIGIAEEHVGDLFTAFSQADSSITRRFGGTGLGLAISKRLANELGGDVTASSVLGKGSTFALRIPVRPGRPGRQYSGAPAIQDISAGTVQGDGAADDKPLRDRRILLVEDSTDNQRLISLLLRKAGADVVIAENGQIGVDRLLERQEAGLPFHAVLMDMQMPVLDGYEATRRLRRKGVKTPILALTAHAMTEDRQRCLNAGCDEYLTKPIDRQTLIGTVARFCLDIPTRPPTPIDSGEALQS